MVSSPDSSGGEDQVCAVHGQPSFLDPHGDAVRGHGCSACWTFPRLCSRHHGYFGCGLRFLRGWVHSSQDRPHKVYLILYFRCQKHVLLLCFLSVSLLFVTGLSLLCILCGVAFFSVTVSLILIAFQVTISNVLKYSPQLIKVLCCRSIYITGFTFNRTDCGTASQAVGHCFILSSSPLFLSAG